MATAPSIALRQGRPRDFAAMMKFINGAFFKGEPRFERDFGHLYSPEAFPTRCAHLACRDGQIVGHVGIYPLVLNVGPKSAGDRALPISRISVGGIGAVSTDPACRGQGVMGMLLQRVAHVMRRQGYDASILWGDRFRYGNYGWEICGRRMEWTYDARHTAGWPAKPTTARPIEAGDLYRLRRVWNDDSPGTRHGSASLERHLARPNRKTVVTTDGPYAFANIWIKDDRKWARVDKLCGEPAAMRGLLGWIQQNLLESGGQLVVACVPGDQVSRLALSDASGYVEHPQGQMKIIRFDSLMKKLLPALNAQHTPCRATRITLGCADSKQQVTLNIGKSITIVPGACRNVVELSDRQMAAVIFGGPLAGDLTILPPPLRLVLPVMWTVEEIAHV